MSSKVLTLLLSLAAQSGVYARPTGPRAIAEISTNEDHEHRHQERRRPPTYRGAPPSSLRLRRSRRLPRAQVFSATTDITVSTPGKAVVEVRDPRP